jgi:hypothetical protein
MTMKAQVQVLYHEVDGCGDDTKANMPDGVVVMLTKWTTSTISTCLPKSYYVIERTAVNDHEVTIHKFNSIECGWGMNEDANMIRKAMKEFDSMVHAMMPDQE